MISAKRLMQSRAAREVLLILQEEERSREVCGEGLVLGGDAPKGRDAPGRGDSSRTVVRG